MNAKEMEALGIYVYCFKSYFPAITIPLALPYFNYSPTSI